MTDRIPKTDGPCPDDMDVGVKYLPDATEAECVAQAHWAYSYGHGIDRNPYARGTFQFDWWHEAWHQNEEDDEG